MRIITLFVLSLGVFGCAPSHIAWVERRFMHQDRAYYRELAQACDVVQGIEKVESNEFLLVDVEKSVLPAPISNLHPIRLVMGGDNPGVSLDFGGDNDSFFISWGPDPVHTNVWVLTGNVRGSSRVVYAETK